MKPLAILGGTFDPVHIGHLRVAWEAAETLDAELRLVPARVPPHRPQPCASADERVALLNAALAGQSRLVLDTRELRRDGPSWSIDTLADLRLEIGSRRPLVLLVGSDAFAGLSSWHRWREIFELAHVGVLARAGHAPVLPAELETEVALRQASPEALRAAPAGCIASIAVTPLEISASAIRSLLSAGREPRYLLPDGVLANPGLLRPYRCIRA